MKRFDVVTVGRSDWGIWRPVLRRLSEESNVRVRLLVGGAHLLRGHGHGLADIEGSDFGEVLPVPMSVECDSPLDVATTIGRGVAAFAACFAAHRPDLVLVLGDRYEMFAAAVAAVPFVLPIAHLHGGERTGGAIDDVMRHAMTKMSHLHYVSAEAHAQRVRQMGEEPWRVVVAGAPALDELLRLPSVTDTELSEQVGLDVSAPFALCTFHPTTLEPGSAHGQAQALLHALDDVGIPVVFTMPNADTGGQVIRGLIATALSTHPRWRAHESLGHHRYGALLARAAVVVGNSSSGIIEAPTFRVPVVNIGERQSGRVRAFNVVDVTADRAAIAAAMVAALKPEFREGISTMSSPFGDGHASERIVASLMKTLFDERLLKKDFVDTAGDRGTSNAA